MGFIEFELNGIAIKSPLGWQETTVNASFKSGVQPNINQDSYTFGSDSLVIIDSWLNVHGFYRGCPLVIKEDGYVVYEGYLDFYKKYVRIHKGKAEIGVTMAKGLNHLVDEIEGYTFSLLQKNSPLLFANIPYIVEKKTNYLELALVSVTTLILLKETYEAIKRVSASVKELSVAVSNTPFNVGLLLGVALQLVIDIVYVVAMVKALKETITSLFNNLISPVRYHKGMNVDSTLNSFFNVIGFNGYQTGIKEFKSLYYLPSKEDDAKSEGIPSAGDYGYYMPEFISLLKKATQSKLAVDNVNTVQFRSENDSYFIKNSTFVMPDVLLESENFNIDEIKGTKTIAFDTDVNDEWTIDNFKGTAYDIYTKTTSTSGTNLVKGLEEIKLEVCLATRKDKLNDLETALKGLGSLLDGLVNALGGNSALSNRVSKRVGMIKVSQNNWSKPKLVMLDSQLHLPTSYRSQWSAKAIYNKWVNENSFVLNGFHNQKKVFKGVEIPFNLVDLKKCINNSYFTTANGERGKFTDLKKGLDSGSAIADFWIREVFDNNLKEEYVEP